MGPATGIYEWHGGIARGYDIIRDSICRYVLNVTGISSYKTI
jgi:hypothetical protein